MRKKFNLESIKKFVYEHECVNKTLLKTSDWLVAISGGSAEQRGS